MLNGAQLTAMLRGAGLRRTAPRIAVLTELAEHPHASAEAVAAGVRAQLGTVSTQAIYDVLHALTDAGLVRRIEPAGSPARYEPRRGDDHHHVVCRICGSIADINFAVGAAPCLNPGTAHGYLVDEVELTFWGICPSCQQVHLNPASPKARTEGQLPEEGQHD